VGAGVLAVLRADRLVELPEHEPLERLGLKADGTLAEARHEVGGPSEEQVAREDGDRVAPHGVRAGDAATTVRVVHDVVVVERGEVGDLDGLGGRDHLVHRSVAELGGEDEEHRAHALAAGLEEVTAGGVGEVVGEAQFGGETRFNGVEPLLDGGEQTLRLGGREHPFGEPQLLGQARPSRGGAWIHSHSLSERPCSADGVAADWQ
jgi:hypothetical protein